MRICAYSTGFCSRPLEFSMPSIYFEVDHCGAVPPRRLSKLSCCFSRAHSIGKNMASTPVPDADVWVCSACPQKNAADHMVCRTCGEDRPAARTSVCGRRSATVAKNHPAALAVSRARRAPPLAGGSGPVNSVRKALCPLSFRRVSLPRAQRRLRQIPIFTSRPICHALLVSRWPLLLRRVGLLLARVGGSPG